MPATPVCETEATGLILWRGDAATSFSSPVYTLMKPFDRAVLSWNGSGDACFEIEINDIRHVIGFSGTPPHAVKGPSVDVDTLRLDSPAPSFRFHARLYPGAKISLIALACWTHACSAEYSAQRSSAWGTDLAVHERSQMIEEKDPRSICSPTSLSMILDFYGIHKSTREVTEAVFDHSAKIYGNWALNTAYAHRASGLESFVVRATGLEDIEIEIASGRPVVASLRWGKGQLEGAPIETSTGHLMVVRGFTPSGDVIVNDPAAQPGAVRRVYKRREFFAAWIERASGIMYVFRRTH